MLKHNKMKTGLAAFFALGTFVMVAYVVVQLLIPADLGTFKNLKLDNNVVKAGSLVFYEAKECTPAKYQADVFRTISTNTIPPEVTLGSGARFDDRLLCRNVILIPNEAPTGEYRLTITVEYHVNAFQDRTETYISEPFKVINENDEFNILEDAVRNENERIDGQPITPATPTTPQAEPSSSTRTSPAPSAAAPSQPATPQPSAMVIPQGPIQRTVNGLTEPIRCNTLISILC